MPPAREISLADVEGWPVDDIAHHREQCACCGLGLGTGRVVRLFDGECYHPICWEPPARPSRGDALNLWLRCRLVTDVRYAGDETALRYLIRRRLASAAFRYDMVRLLPHDLPAAQLPSWACYRGRSWVQTGHRLIVPVYDHAGRLALVRGWRWDDDDSPKRLAAAGQSVRGLVMAAGRGLEMLRGQLPDWLHPVRVLVVEGEPDTIAATARWPEWCVVGIAPGCWCEELASRMPSGAQVLLRTDSDDAGDIYAEQIAETLKGRCDVRRTRDNG